MRGVAVQRVTVMNRRAFGLAGFFAGAFASVTARAAAAGKDTGAAGGGTPSVAEHRLVVQVSTDDAKVQRMALGNAGAYAAHYRARGEPFALEVVAFGPGYGMLAVETSMVRDRIAQLQQSLGATITFTACQNSRRGVAEAQGKTPEQIVELPGIADTPAGVVRVAELQEQGWSYVRP